MNIFTLVSGNFQINTYILTKDKESPAVVIDPGFDFDKIKNFIIDNASGVEAVLLTHGHMDHIPSLKKLVDEFTPKVYIHKDDAIMLTSPEDNLSSLLGTTIIADNADVLLDGDETLDILNTQVKVIHTPGHSKGCVVYLVEDNAFTGDTLFCNSIGRVDFPHSNQSDMKNSLETLINLLPEKTKIYPGHGPSSTMESELKNNPYL